MKRMKALVCCAAAACLAMVLAGCSSQQSYTPPEKSATVSSPTIGKSGTLRVGVNAGSPPLAGSPSSSSKIVGIDVDVAAALADQLGLKLEIVDVGTDPEAALKEGKVDVAMGIGSESDVSFWRSPAYLPKGVALFSTPANATVPTKASSPKIAAQVSSTSSWQVTNEFGQDALVSENDLKSAFAALADGSAQYVAADAVIGMYAAHSGDYDAQIVALMQQPGGYCVGVLEANTELQAAVKAVHVQLAVEEITRDLIARMGRSVKEAKGNTLLRLNVYDRQAQVSLNLFSKSYKVSLTQGLVSFFEDNDIKYTVI